MSKKKIALLCTICALSVIYILQLALSNSGKAKQIVSKVEPDSIRIENISESVDLHKENDEWVIGNEKLPVKEDSVKNMINAYKNIRVLDTVSKDTSEATLSRYGLLNPVRVTFTAGNKKAPVLLVGKASMTGSQTYIKFEGKKEIYLCAANLNTYFPVNKNDFVDYVIYKTNISEVFKIAIQHSSGNEWAIEKTGEMAQVMWKNADNTNPVELDSAKINEWISSITILEAKDWADESVDYIHENSTIVTINAAQDVIKIEINPYKNGYLCTSSKTPYLFTISKEDGDKFMKNLNDFVSEGGAQIMVE